MGVYVDRYTCREKTLNVVINIKLSILLYDSTTHIMSEKPEGNEPEVVPLLYNSGGYI